MRFKRALVWSVINGQPHKFLNKKEQTISGLMPLIEALFPGMNYYSITGFGLVMVEFVTPALKKLFPELASTPAENITRRDAVEVSEFLPSDGYEWQDSEEWRKNFKKLLAA